MNSGGAFVFAYTPMGSQYAHTRNRYHINEREKHEENVFLSHIVQLHKFSAHHGIGFYVLNLVSFPPYLTNVLGNPSHVTIQGGMATFNRPKDYPRWVLNVALNKKNTFLSRKKRC